MRHTPKTEEQLSNILPDGIYQGTVKRSSDHISQSGNTCLKLEIDFFDALSKKTTSVVDYLVDGGYKLRHACYTTGLDTFYESGDIPAYAFDKKIVLCVVKIKKGESDNKGGFYPDKNVITDYLDKNKSSQAVSQSDAKKSDPIDDEIPF